MNRAGSAPGFWSRLPHSARTSSTRSAVTHSVSTPSRTSSDNPAHGCISSIMPTATCHRTIVRSPQATALTGQAQMGLHQPAASRATAHGSRDPKARDPHRDGQSHLVRLEYTTRAVTCVSGDGLKPSGGGPVFVGESAEYLFSADPVLGEIDLRWPGVRLSRWQLALWGSITRSRLAWAVLWVGIIAE